MVDTLYISGDSFLHRYDCRLKLMILPFMVVFFFLPQTWFSAAALLFFLCLITVFSLGIRDLILPLKMIYPLLILIVLLTPFFYREGNPLLNPGGFVILTEKGLTETFLYISRFWGITLSFFLLFRTTPMEDMILGLSWLRMPYTLTLIISVALRYIPHLAGLYGQISAAHSLRCSMDDPPPKRGLLVRIRKLFPILVSLMIQGVKTIPTLSMALELKGVGRDNPRTRYRKLSAPGHPYTQILITLALLVFVGITLLI